MKIAFIYKKRTVDIDGIFKKTSPTDQSYGAFDLIEMGHHVDLIAYDLWSSTYIPRKSLSIFSNLIAPYIFNRKAPGEYIIEAFRLGKMLENKYDLIVSIPSKITLGLACCKSWANISPKIIGIQTGILNKTDRWYQKKVLGKTFKFIHSIVLGEGEFNEIRDRYSLGTNHVSLIPFGVDTDFWTFRENPNAEPMVLSVGDDYFRDYELLLKVARLIPVKFVIVSRSKKLSGALPPNVQIIKGSLGRPALTFLQLRHLYQSALCVITPLKETFQPSGQSSTLQAMACGIPTVVAKTNGLWSRQQVKDGETALVYQAGDVRGCYDAIQALLSDRGLRETISRNARQIVESQANSRKFAQDLIKVAAML